MAKLYEYGFNNSEGFLVKDFHIEFICAKCSARHTFRTGINVSKPVELPEKLITDCLCGEKLECFLPEQLTKGLKWSY